MILLCEMEDIFSPLVVKHLLLQQEGKAHSSIWFDSQLATAKLLPFLQVL